MFNDLFSQRKFDYDMFSGMGEVLNNINPYKIMKKFIHKLVAGIVVVGILVIV